MNRIALVIAFIVASACAHAAGPKPIRTVTLVPATEPLEYGITVRSSTEFFVPLVSLGTHSDSKQRTKAFTELMKGKAFNHGAFLSDQVAERLRASGYQVTILSDVARPAGDPDSIDYEKVAFETDLALQVRIEAIGFHSGFGSIAYVPKVNVGVISFTRKGADYPYEASIYFGVDARRGKDWAILSPETVNFVSYEALVADPGAVDAIYREALGKIADRLVAQFKAVSPLAPASPQ